MIGGGETAAYRHLSIGQIVARQQFTDDFETRIEERLRHGSADNSAKMRRQNRARVYFVPGNLIDESRSSRGGPDCGANQGEQAGEPPMASRSMSMPIAVASSAKLRQEPMALAAWAGCSVGAGTIPHGYGYPEIDLHFGQTP